MGNIAIVVDAEEGHVFSTFGFASRLQERGHEVCYIGFQRVANLVSRQGFKFIPALSHVVTTQRTEAMPRLRLGPLANGTVLDHAVKSIGCDLFITLSMLCLEALALKYRYNVPVVLLRNHFSLVSRAQLCREIVIGKLLESTDDAYDLVQLLVGAGLSIKNFSDIAALVVNEMTEIVLFPSEFGTPEMSSDDKMCYAGSAIAVTRLNDSFEWERIDLKRKLVYCSLGSQADLKLTASCHFFHLLIELFTTRYTELQLILSTGSHINAKGFNQDARNIYVGEWVPQLEILRHADIMINHGGIGSVQECILMGVPMIVAPLMRDQFSCADKVAELGLGLRADVETASVHDISLLIDRVLNEPDFKARVRTIRSSFLSTTSQTAVDMVDSVLKQSRSTK